MTTITIQYQPATLAEFLQAIAAVNALGGISQVAVTRPPVNQLPRVPGVSGNRQSSLSSFYKEKTGLKFRLGADDCAAVQWEGAPGECPNDKWELALEKRLLSLGVSPAEIAMAKGESMEIGETDGTGAIMESMDSSDLGDLED